MSYRIDEIEGIGPAYAEKLGVAGIRTTDDLLNFCGNAAGRKKVSEQTGVIETSLLKWANMADLMRISGVGPQFAELLEASGVDTVKELRMRSAENLATKMTEINSARNLTKGSTAATVIEGWIQQAKAMEPKITH